MDVDKSQKRNTWVTQVTKKKNQQKTTFTKWAYVTHFFAKNNKKAWAIVIWAVNFTIKKEDIMDIITLL